MADRAISQLTEATEVQSADLFVLEQTGVAMKVTGYTLMQDLATALAGHGGIANIAYTAPVSPSLAGTMTITLADGTDYTVSVANGNGITGVVVNYGISTSGTNPALVQSWSSSVTPPTNQCPYLWTRLVYSYKDGTSTTAYSVTVKADDTTVTIGTVSATPGVSAAATVTNSGTENDPILDFSFTLPQGDKGDTGDYIVPVVSYGTSTAAATEPSTWYSSPSSISYTAGNFIWQKTEYTLHDAQTVQSTEKKIIGYIGQNGSGSGTVQQITFNGTVYPDDGTGNVPMTVDAEDVGAIADPSTKSNGQVLTYDSSADEWVAANPSTGNVNTVNSKGVDAGTTNVTIYATDIKMSSGDNTTVANAIPPAGTSAPDADTSGGSAGSAATYAKSDHRHKLNVPTSGTPANLGTASQGSATTYSRSDHVHAMPSASDVGALASSTTAADIGGMSKWVLLWTNASITSDFAAQTVQVDLTGYDIVAVEAVYAGTSLSNSSFFFGKVGSDGFHITSIGPLSGSNSYVAERGCTFAANGIAVSAATRKAMSSTSAGSASAGNAIPYRIYGIKGVVSA